MNRLKPTAVMVALALSAAAHAADPPGLKEVLEQQKRAAAPEAPAREAPAPAAGRQGKAAAPAVPAARPEAPEARKAEPAREAGVDPMKGRPAILEDKTRELEDAQLEARIAAERLAKRKAEVEMKKLDLELKAQTAAPLPDLDEALRRLERPAQKSAAPKPPEPPPAASVPAVPRLAGTLTSDGETVALIERGGRLSAVRAGETAAGLRLEQVEEGAAVVNGARVTTDTRVGRLNWSSEREPRPREEGAAAGALPAPPLPLPGQASPFGPAVGGGVPQR